MIGGVMALALHTGKVHINTYPGRAGQSNISSTEINECNVYSIYAVYCTKNTTKMQCNVFNWSSESGNTSVQCTCLLKCKVHLYFKN